MEDERSLERSYDVCGSRIIKLDKKHYYCKICKEQQHNVILYPCCHVCICYNCSFKTSYCMICDAVITHIKKIKFVK